MSFLGVTAWNPAEHLGINVGGAFLWWGAGVGGIAP